MMEGSRDGFVRALEESTPLWGQELRAQGMVDGCLFEKDGDLYLYLETSGEGFEWKWPDACREMLQLWPGEKGGCRLAVPMLDIFHDGEAEGREFRSGDSVRERIGSLARLKPEMYGSYVFYHYAKQEETPGSFNSTYMIGAHENIIFSYHELPAPKGESQSTRRTWPEPITPNNWHDIMLPHFIPWSSGESGPVLWEKMSILLSF
ncbi:hypothetical protein GCM10020370_45710 [Paenibacillus hodogayensis]